jgi:hypothetical protein
MSKSSRKHLSRSELKRRRQLKEQGSRLESREEASSKEKEFRIERFVAKHFITLMCVALLVIGILIVRLIMPNMEDLERIDNTVSGLILDRSYDWALKYPFGYKIIALTDKKIIHTNYDSLPSDLQINWKKLVAARIEADLLSDIVESIKVELKDIKYDPANVTDLSVRTTITRYKGARTRLAQIGSMDFMIEIVEDNGEHVFCLLGLQ